MDSFFIFIGLVAAVVGGIAVKKRELPRFKIASRKQGVVVLSAGLLTMMIGGAIAGPSEERPKTPTAQVAVQSPSPVEASPIAPPPPSPSPTPSPSPSPSPSPVIVQAAPPAPPKTQAPPKPTGVNGNPWGYNYESGEYISNPPQSFCSYFDCIDNFWNGRGYVVQCDDQMFGKSGGIQGACSHHGGVFRPLYSPAGSPH